MVPVIEALAAGRNQLRCGERRSWRRLSGGECERGGSEHSVHRSGAPVGVGGWVRRVWLGLPTLSTGARRPRPLAARGFRSVAPPFPGVLGASPRKGLGRSRFFGRQPPSAVVVENSRPVLGSGRVAGKFTRNFDFR